MTFVERHGLWTEERSRAANEVEKLVESHKLEVVRLSFADQHGVLRGKSVVADELPHMMREGSAFPMTLLAKDTAHRTVAAVLSLNGAGFTKRDMEAAADVVIVPDPATFHILPWASGTGWLLCDLFFTSGRPVEISTRYLYRRCLERLAEAGFDHVVGLEVEFHIFKLDNPRLALEDAGQPGPAPEVSLLTQGYQHLTELRYDQLDPVLEMLRRNLTAMGLPLRTLEVEYGPSQCEFTFQPRVGLESADMMTLARSAIKQVCRRHGYLASFMCRPRIPNVFSSGWHLHQSLRERRSGTNVFVPPHGEILSSTGKCFLAGLLTHATGATALSTPTINGYRRYGRHALAPDRAVWAHDHRNVMVRVLGAPGDAATRLENRIGEPAANPYLYMASQVISGLDGIARKLDPGPPADAPYESAATMLPRSLTEAVAALRRDECLRAGFGSAFIDYYSLIKEAEVARFEREITEWEQREYLEIF
ncbi:MAG TPA: glutamine synthetase family protein [Candidatus Binataceae bacterium]|nr:glutamine synthetase family protein [Candidatus Binataceae bacterium]